jgi:hypothetical protein
LAPAVGLDDDRRGELAAGLVAQLRAVVDQRIEAERHEIHVGDADERPQPRRRGADAHAHHRRFGDRHVAHALVAEARVQARELAVRAAEAPDVLA